MAERIGPHPDGLVSVVLTDGGVRHVLRAGPTWGPLAKTLCGRSAEHVIDSAEYCCHHSWRQRGWICATCNDVLWNQRD